MSGLSSSLEGLIDGVIPDKPETFLALQRETTRMQRLVNDLENLSRAEAGQIRIDPRPIALGDSIRTVTERLRPQFEDKGVTLDLAVPSGLPQAMGDPNRTMQVLMNLLGNALQ